MTTVTLLHPGAMGAVVGDQLVRAGHRVLWVGAERSAATRERAAAAGLEERASIAAAVGESDVVLSICPPEFAEQLAHAVAVTAFAGVYVDANAIAPQRMARILEVVGRAAGDAGPAGGGGGVGGAGSAAGGGAGLAEGATVVDGGIIGPPPQRAGTTRLYLSGAGSAGVAELFAATALEAVVLDGDVGAASALKLAYAGYQKISRVLSALAHGLAREHGVGAELEREAELLRSRPLADVDAFASAASKAWRWAPEMREVADAMRAGGLPGDVAQAAALALERWAPAKDRTDLPLDELLALLAREPPG
jgi:Domain of unknown function (DUF1932)